MLAEPALAHYLPDRAAGRDRAWVAEADDGAPPGAAWWRFLPAGDPGYGFVSAEVPEVAVGVVQAQRGRGTGTALLHALLSAAAAQGLPGLSLSVEPDNPAARLYRRLGFTRVGGDGGADTMLLTLR